MIEFHLVNSIGIVLTGLLVGFLSGLFGVGGGFLMTPLLRIVFGLPYNVAVGSDLTAITFTSLYGMFKHHRLAHVNFKLGLIILAGMLPGVEIGARILVFIRNSPVLAFGKVPIMDIVMNMSYLSLFIAAALLMFIEYRKWSASGQAPRDLSCYELDFYFFGNTAACPKDSVNVFALLLVGLLIGMAKGFLGVGGGFIMVPVLVNLFCVPAALVVGTSLFILCPSSAYGAVSHYFKGNVNIILVGLILCGSIVGSYVGANLTEKIRGKKFRLYFIYVILLATIMIFAKTLMQVH